MDWLHHQIDNLPCVLCGTLRSCFGAGRYRSPAEEGRIRRRYYMRAKTARTVESQGLDSGVKFENGIMFGLS